MSTFAAPSAGQPADIAFASLRGRRLAYGLSGAGYPLVRAPHWLTHLQGDWQTGAWAPWLADLSSRYRLLRFDPLGTGLSDDSNDPVTLDGLVEELAAVVDAAGLERFALLGMSQGAAVSIRYAVRFPHRVSHLVLIGGYARGSLVRCPGSDTQRLLDALCQVVRMGWGVDNSAFRQIFTTQFFPGGNPQQIKAFNDLELLSTRPERAAQLLSGFANIDASTDLALVRCPTLAFHTLLDARIPFEEGRWMASAIPHCQFVPLAGVNHLPLVGDPNYERLLSKVSEFLPRQAPVEDRWGARLNGKELELLELLAQGLDNAQIAAHLGRAEKTVRNRVSALFDLLQVEGRSQAIVYARDRGLGVGRSVATKVS